MTLKDEYNARKKDGTIGTSANPLKGEYQRRKAASDLNSLINDANDFYGEAAKRLTGASENYVQAKDFHNEWVGSSLLADEYKAKATGIRATVDKYKDDWDREYGEGTYQSIVDALDGIGTSMDAVTGAINGQEQFWSQFPTEYDYNDFKSLQKWQNVSDADDFEEKSVYDAGKTGYNAKRKNSSDPLYDYVNGADINPMFLRGNTASGSLGFSSGGTTEWNKLDKDTVSKYNYIYETEGADAARRYLELTAGKKFTGAEAFGLSFLEGGGVNSLSTAISKLFGGKETDERANEDYYRTSRETGQAAAENKGAAFSGSVAGGVAEMLALSKLSGFLPSVTVAKGASTAAQIGAGVANAAIRGSALMGTKAAINNAGAVATGNQSAKDYIVNVLEGTAGGALGGAASAGIGAALGNVVSKLGLGSNVLANTFIAGVQGATYAGTADLAESAVDFIGYGEVKNITAEQIMQDALAGFAFGALSYASGFAFSRQWENVNTDAEDNSKASSLAEKYFGKDWKKKSTSELKKAYYSLSKTMHPDVGGNTEAFQDLNDAYRFATSSVAKTTYKTYAKAKASGDTATAQQAAQKFKSDVLYLAEVANDGALTADEASAIDVLEGIAKNIDSTIIAGTAATAVPSTTQVATPAVRTPAQSAVQPSAAPRIALPETNGAQKPNLAVTDAGKKAEEVAQAIRDGNNLPENADDLTVKQIANAAQDTSAQITEAENAVAISGKKLSEKALEDSKKELAKALDRKSLSETENKMADLLNSGSLEFEQLTIGRAPSGFTKEQQTSAIRQLLDGQKASGESVTANIPNDGSLTTKNDPVVVAHALSRLGARLGTQGDGANSVSSRVQKLLSSKNADSRSMYFKANDGAEWVTTGTVTVRVDPGDNASAIKPKAEYSGSVVNVAEKWFSKDYPKKLDGGVFKVKGHSDYLVPSGDDKYLIIPKAALPFIDKPGVTLATTNDAKAIIARDAAGEPIALLFVQKPVNANANDVLPVKTKMGTAVSTPEKSSIGKNVEGRKTENASSANPNANGSPESDWTAERVGDKNAKPKSLTEIVEEIRQKFGMNVTTGYVRGKGVFGTHDKVTGGIRTRVANELPTIAHEFAHELDSRYDITKNMPEGLRNQMMNYLSDEMRQGYKPEQWLRESFAEFVRQYLQNSEEAMINSPDLVAHFLNSMSEKDAAEVQILADEINAYYSLGAENMNIHRADEKRPDYRTGKEKARGVWGKLQTNWFDSEYYLRVMDAELGSSSYNAAKNAAYTGARIDAIINGDYMYDYDGKVIGPGLKAALSGVNLKDTKIVNDFGEYLVARRAPYVLAKGRRVSANPVQNNTAFFERRERELLSAHPEFKEASERLYQFEHDLVKAYGVDTGLISEELFNKWLEDDPFHVPFNRFMPIESRRGNGTKRGFADQKTPFHKMVGSGLELLNPLDSEINNVVKLVTAGIRNKVAQEIARAAELDGSALWLEPITKTSVTTVSTAAIKDALSDTMLEKINDGTFSKEDKDALTEIVNGIADTMTQYGIGFANKAKSEIAVMFKGKPKFYHVNDPDLMNVLVGFGDQAGPIARFVGGINRWITNNITGGDPVWGISRNAIKDLYTYMVNGSDYSFIDRITHLGKAYLVTFTHGRGHLGAAFKERYQLYKALGGGGGGFYSGNKDFTKQAIRKIAGVHSKNPFTYVGDAISYITNAIEAGPRFAAFNMGLDHGLSPQDAFRFSMQITVDFASGGRYGKQLNKFIPFSNAQLVSIDTARQFFMATDKANQGKEERMKYARKRIINFVAVSALLGLLEYAINHKDEEDADNYENRLSSYTKNNFFVIPTSDGKYIAIPKDRELSMFASFTADLMSRTVNKNKHAFDDFGEYVADNILPSTIADAITGFADDGLRGAAIGAASDLGAGLGTAISLGANMDFLGRAIEPSYMEDWDKRDRWTAGTSYAARLIGSASGMSPIAIDYFMQNTAGYKWKWLKYVAPVDSSRADYTLGVKSQWYKDALYSTDLPNWLYDLRDKDLKASNHTGSAEKLFNYKIDDLYTSFYSTYAKIEREEPDSDEKRDTRAKVMTMICEYRDLVDAGRAGMLEDIKDVYVKYVNENGTDGASDLLPRTVSNTIKTSNTLYALTATQYYEYQTYYNAAYFEYVEKYLPRAKDAAKANVLKSAKRYAASQANSYMLKELKKWD